MTACIVDQIPVGPLAVFSYLLSDSATKEAAVIDPGAEPRKIYNRVREKDVRVRWLICTHSHPDHVGATAALKELTGADLAIHEREADFMGKWTRKLVVRVLGGRMEKRVDRRLCGGDRLEFGDGEIEVLHTPGHSPGSICLLVDGNLFSGDTLFIGGVGRTDLPGASMHEMAHSLKTKIMTLPQDTRIWPGHDYGPTPSGLLRDEIRQNSFLQPGFLG